MGSSSMSTTAGLPTRATAMLSLRLFPPLHASHTLQPMPGLVSRAYLITPNNKGSMPVDGSSMIAPARLPIRAFRAHSLRFWSLL